MNYSIAREVARTPAQSGVSRARQGRTPSRRKSRLVDSGLALLSRSEWHMAMALTDLIREKGLSHE
jgi:hypothetical protein